MTTQEQKHEEEMPKLEGQEDPKLNRGEKKARKALVKIGMKPVNGVTRVTLKKRDGLIFVIAEPEVLRSDDGKSFVVFGELKLEDPNMRMQQAEAKKFQDNQAAAAQAQYTNNAKKEAAKPSAPADVPLSEEGLTANHIDLVMEHAQCSRNEAIKALHESKDDMINAVMKLTN
jgi:nascent polypeptide-associated complex subunit alpha